ncbi:Hypothetical predicted protein [Podarcis lilfordi]|uniref:Uncharacterized protein n=1 Tax=Podarcis lilfordi TaxID=74358 RepID=A0AA35PR34_9SAUR|nr:Hypothetical predicted protein [Podarcis lilfordi]
MEKAFLCVVFLLLIYGGAPEEKESQLSTASMGATEPPATVSEGTEGRGTSDPNFSGSTAEVGLNQTESPTDGELQPNTTYLPLEKKRRQYYPWVLLLLLCFSPYVVALVSVTARCFFSRQCRARWQCGGSDVEMIGMRLLNSSDSEIPSPETSDD